MAFLRRDGTRCVTANVALTLRTMVGVANVVRGVPCDSSAPSSAALSSY